MLSQLRNTCYCDHTPHKRRVLLRGRADPCSIPMLLGREKRPMCRIQRLTAPDWALSDWPEWTARCFWVEPISTWLNYDSHWYSHSGCTESYLAMRMPPSQVTGRLCIWYRQSWTQERMGWDLILLFRSTQFYKDKMVLPLFGIFRP